MAILNMKKSTLNKLVKQALYEIYKEKNKEIPKGLQLEKITPSEFTQINNILSKKDTKKRKLLREQRQTEKSKQIYDLLVNSNESGTPVIKIEYLFKLFNDLALFILAIFLSSYHLSISNVYDILSPLFY